MTTPLTSRVSQCENRSGIVVSPWPAARPTRRGSRCRSSRRLPAGADRGSSARARASAQHSAATSSGANVMHGKTSTHHPQPAGLLCRYSESVYRRALSPLVIERRLPDVLSITAESM